MSVMGEDPRGSGDLLLNHAQYAFVLDENKGTISTYVGPNRQAISQNDRPVVFNKQSGEFDQANIARATQSFTKADEGSYIVLTNPTVEESKAHPASATSSQLPDLNYGRKVNIPGPARFPLWPGQITEVISGHQLRSNEYLLIRVYNEDEAKLNWKNAVVRPQAQDDETLMEVMDETDVNKIVLGQLMIIRGDEYSFYIPPTGIEVVPDGHTGDYVRKAVTLERLEYCILLDESGDKRYVQGPDVVFPNPTEHFVVEGNNRKFKAIELNNDMGLYIKVIAEYEGNKIGDELFITGREQKIYYPRPEHAILTYGDQSIHFAVAIPAGEARYVLNKDTGDVKLVMGPQMCLPDPRKEVFVRRVLDRKTVDLLYPGNTEAIKYNANLESINTKGTDFVSEESYRSRSFGNVVTSSSAWDSGGLSSYLSTSVSDKLAGDTMNRHHTFTPPRTLTLDSKYDGAVGVNIWTGYAVQIVSKKGTRKVVPGPTSILLAYDESLEATELSTGTPKNRERTLKTVYLRVKNNKVSDRVQAVTKDLVEVETTVSYRVNFEGEPDKWFEVEDYVGFLTEHLRSMIRNAVKHYGIEEFMENSADIIRDTVLGITNKEDGTRPGRAFAENGMRVYDVEILNVDIEDHEIESMLIDAQYDTVRAVIVAAERQRKLDTILDEEEIAQQAANARSESRLKELQLLIEEEEAKEDLEIAKVNSLTSIASMKDELASKSLAAELGRNTEKLEFERKTTEQRAALRTKEIENNIMELAAGVDAEVKRAAAISPQLTEAITVMGNKMLAAQLANSLGPLSAVREAGVTDTFNTLFEALPGMAKIFVKNMEEGS